MEVNRPLRRLASTLLCWVLLACELVGEEPLLYLIRPEQRRIEVRNPSRLPRARIPESTPPRTVANPQPGTEVWQLSLDEAIRIALANSRVVRVLTGMTAVASGSTIYDPAVTNTTIDEEQAAFDPRVEVNNTFNQFEEPLAAFDPNDPSLSLLDGSKIENYEITFGLAKKFATGADLRFEFQNDTSAFTPPLAPLNPQNDYSQAIRLTQPLLQGGGLAANLAPIVIARIETERSYFQFKGSMQDLVRSVAEGYWDLVFARTNVWARRQQVEQSEFSLRRAEARREEGFADIAEVSQTRVALANFRANLIAAEAELLNTEAALRNLLGLPPNDMRQIVPTTPPVTQPFRFDWEGLLNMAEQRRPDIIELKLILEADEQQVLLARNQAQPRLDAVGLYRWNGLEGEMPNGQRIGTTGDSATDWTLGVNFSVPLGLRQGRAALRRTELVIARDRANLQQGMHAATHQLASNVRLHANAFEQYRAYQDTRAAAELNLQQQLEEYRAGRAIFLNVLEAIANWGNAVSSEAQALTEYNTAMAGLEAETGTILETHGIRFLEERFASIGPLGLPVCKEFYPEAEVPTPNADRYENSQRPAEDFFDLQSPVQGIGQSQPPAAEEIPRPLLQRTPPP